MIYGFRRWLQATLNEREDALRPVCLYPGIQRMVICVWMLDHDLSSAIFGASLFTFDWNPSSLNIPGLAHSKYQGVLAEPNLPSVTILRRGRFAREAAYRGICN